jgi:phage baseplate assembly protein W
MPGIIKQYTDFDLSFNPHPITGDITILKNVDAIKKSIRNLIYSDLYERPFQNKLGSGIRQLLFENISPLTQKSIELAVIDVIRAFEKRVTIISCIAKVNTDQNGYEVTLTVSINNISQTVSIDLFLERIR